MSTKKQKPVGNKNTSNQAQQKPVGNKNTSNQAQQKPVGNKNNRIITMRDATSSRISAMAMNSDFDKKKLDALALIAGLDDSNAEDRRLLSIIVNTQKVGTMGIDNDVAGTMPVNYKSTIAKELLFVVMELDGALVDLMNRSNGTSGFQKEVSFKQDVSEIKKLGQVIEDGAIKAKTSVETEIAKAYAKGYGKKRSVEEFRKQKIKDSSEEITKLVSDGKTISEIATQLELPEGMLQNSYNIAVKTHIESKMTEIEKLVASGKSLEEVADKIKLESAKVKKVFNTVSRTHYESKKDEIMKLDEEGKSLEDIAKTLKLDETKLSGLVANWRGQAKKAKKTPQDDSKEEAA